MLFITKLRSNNNTPAKSTINGYSGLQVPAINKRVSDVLFTFTLLTLQITFAGKLASCCVCTRYNHATKGIG